MSSTSTPAASNSLQFPSQKIPILPLPSSINSKSKNTNDDNLPKIPTLPNNTNLTFPVISCEQSTNTKNSTGKPTKRGRKPLSTLPSTKKHIQNLTNQRAFRLRRETYVKTLENRNAVLETLYYDARNEIKSLKERLTSLEKQILKFGGVNSGENDFCDVVGDSFNVNINNNSSSHPNHDNDNNNSCCDLLGTSDTQNTFIVEDTHFIRNLENGNNNNSSFLSTNSFYDNSNKALSFYNNLRSKSPQPDLQLLIDNMQIVTMDSDKRESTIHSHNLSTVQDITSNDMFCDTIGDLCYCEPISDDLMTIEEDTDVDNNDNHDKTYNNLYPMPSSSSSRSSSTSSSSSSSSPQYYIDKKGRRIWLVPKQIVAQCMPPLDSDNDKNFSQSSVYNINLMHSPADVPTNQWGSQSDYYSQSSAITTTSPSQSINAFDPLNLKWITTDTHTENQSIEG